ncbi:MAG: ATP-binding protein [Clostridia bacterium]|nr:ATP-binding protein [Clostridia bacterium]
MINNDRILNAVFALYEKRKNDSENKAYEINNFLNTDKNWEQNRYQIKDISMQIAKAEYFGESINIEALKEKREFLKQERAKLLKSKNLSESDLAPNYHCKKCNDSGYFENGKLCECFFDTLSTVCEGFLNISTPVLPSFEKYISCNPTQEKLKQKFIEYTNAFPPKNIKNLIFTGAPGTGKSFSAGCIASELKAKKHSVIYLTAVKLGDIFLTYHTASVSDKQAIFSLLTSSDLLVIDDLGTEPLLKNVTVEYLTAVISERLNLSKPFIITTNLSMDEIKNRYTERFLSRISSSESARISFSGCDLRQKKN